MIGAKHRVRDGVCTYCGERSSWALIAQPCMAHEARQARRLRKRRRDQERHRARMSPERKAHEIARLRAADPPEKVRARVAAWKKANRDKVNARERERRAEKKRQAAT